MYLLLYGGPDRVFAPFRGLIKGQVSRIELFQANFCGDCRSSAIHAPATIFNIQLFLLALAFQGLVSKQLYPFAGQFQLGDQSGVLSTGRIEFYSSCQFLHGLGIAGALNEIGLPQQAIPLALLFFNVGVEIGQIIFIVGVFVLWMILRPIFIGLPKVDEFAPTYAIGIVAAFWIVELIAVF